MECSKGILLDTNIYIYLSVKDDCGDQKLLDYRDRTWDTILSLPKDCTFYYNYTIYKEVAVGMLNRDELVKTFSLFNAKLTPENHETMYLAAWRYNEYLAKYRKAKDESGDIIKKSKTMPNDCIIGATAEINDYIIVTNNVKDFKSTFPNVEVIGLL